MASESPEGGRIPPILLLICVLPILLILWSVGPQPKTSPEKSAPVVALGPNTEAPGEPAPEEVPLRLERRPGRIAFEGPRLARPRPQEQTPEASPTPERPPPPRPPRTKPTRTNYPRATPRVAAKVNPEVAPRPTPTPTKAPLDATVSESVLVVSAQSNWSVLPADGPTMNAQILIEISPLDRAPPFRKETSLTLVLDVSGSMEFAVESLVSTVLQWLEKGDHNYLVLFADGARVLSGPELSRRSIDMAIATVGKGTQLLAGLEAAGSARVERKDSALVLVTDGHVGPGSVEGASLLAASRLGVPVSVLGIGAECNQAFLTELAGMTRGRFYLVRDPAKVPESIVREFRGITEVVTQDNTLILTLSPGVKVHHAYRTKPLARDLGKPQSVGNTLEFPIGDLRKGETAAIVLEVSLPNQGEGEARVLEARVEYDRGGAHPSHSEAHAVSVHYSNTQTRPERNKKMRNVLPEIQAVHVAEREHRSRGKKRKDRR